jgi:hypothetical protein
MTNTMNLYIADELANKVKVLSIVLQKLENKILCLEKENTILKDILTNLMSINKQDLANILEVDNDRRCAV